MEGTPIDGLGSFAYKSDQLVTVVPKSTRCDAAAGLAEIARKLVDHLRQTDALPDAR